MALTRITDRFEEALVVGLNKRPEIESTNVEWDFIFGGQAGLVLVAVPSPILGHRLVTMAQVDIDSIVKVDEKMMSEMLTGIFQSLAEMRSQALLQDTVEKDQANGLLTGP